MTRPSQCCGGAVATSLASGPPPAVDPHRNKSKSVGPDQLLMAGAHLPAIINQSGARAPLFPPPAPVRTRRDWYPYREVLARSKNS